MSKDDTVNKYGPLIGAIDQGTNSAKFLVFAAKTAEILTYHQIPIKQYYPREGWVEQDPIEILKAVRDCIDQSIENLKQLTINPSELIAIGVTNQRETTVVWNSTTGLPVYNAIVWMDTRSTEIANNLLNKTRRRDKNYLKPLCGLPISPYFSALKLKWLFDNVKSVKEALAEDRLMFGTIDTWLIWNLTGGTQGGAHVTDVTNASRTMLMNLSTLQWDETLLTFFDIPKKILPRVRSSSEIYGYVQDDTLNGVPISGCLGDQQSALVGQMCFKQGQAKNTYGTGCFLLYNTGNAIIDSSNGLLTTVAYQFGSNSSPVYALEGSVAIAGALMEWLKNNVGILSDVKQSETIAKKVLQDNSRIVFVPAFSGLYAPYWRQDARSIISGITDDTTYAHIVKAALEAICFQNREIITAMAEDTGISLNKLLVDGGMSSNNLLMQMQADISGIPVIRPLMAESTGLGVAIAAGLAEGIRKWDLSSMPQVPGDTFYPSISENESEILNSQWQEGVQRSLNWNNEIVPDKKNTVHNITTKGLFIMSTMILLVLAKYYK